MDKKSKSKGLADIPLFLMFKNLFRNIGGAFKTLWYGVKITKFKRVEFLLGFICWTSLPLALAYVNIIARTVGLINYDWGQSLMDMSFWGQLIFWEIIFFVIFLIGQGTKVKNIFKKFQYSLDDMEFRSGKKRPVITRIDGPNDGILKLTVTGPGISVADYEQKKENFASSFGYRLDRAYHDKKDLKSIVLELNNNVLDRQYNYHDLAKNLKKENTFIVGKSLRGLVIEDITDLPHMMVAGTTKSGKSTFFVQSLLGLQTTIPHLQMYLFDFKDGTETYSFRAFDNVKLVEEESDAVRVLKEIDKEMMRRFKYLKKNERKKIIPQRDKMDRIVVAIDEASVFYTKPSSKKDEKAEVIEQARYLTDRIAKLGRAAGINLILATQKVEKATIDTKVRENMTGRICFRTGDMEGSRTVLGNAMAFKIDNYPGRAVWKNGNTYTEIQAPFLHEDDVKETCAQVAVFRRMKRSYKMFSPLIEPGKEAKEVTKKAQNFKD